MESLPDDQEGCQPCQRQVSAQLPADAADLLQTVTDLENLVANKEENCEKMSYRQHMPYMV